MLQSSCFIDDVYTYGGDMINFFLSLICIRYFTARRLEQIKFRFSLPFSPIQSLSFY